MLQEIRKKIDDNWIWISMDETIDSAGQCVENTNILFINESLL